MQPTEVLQAILGTSGLVLGYTVAGIKGVIAVSCVIVCGLLFIAMQEPLQRPQGVYVPYPSRLSNAELSRPEPIRPPPVPATFKEYMAPISNPDFHDRIEHRHELVMVARSPRSGQSADFESNKQWVDATNKMLHEASQLVRPDIHIVYDDDEAGPQHMQHEGAPFEPPRKLDTTLTHGSSAASREWVRHGSIPGHSEAW